MNLNEERNYLKLQEALESLELTDENKALAEQYFEPLQPENTELLKNAKPQDFSQLTPEQRAKTVDYVEHCEKRKKEEELGRFVRFVSAIGGSTAYYALSRYSWGVAALKNHVFQEQWAAMDAEAYVWNAYSLSFPSLQYLFELGKKEPETIYRAISLCYHKYANAKVLLTGIYLGCVAPENTRGGLLKNLFTKNETSNVQKAVNFLETNLSDSLPAMFTAPPLTDAETKELHKFLETDKQNGSVPEHIAAILKTHTLSEYLLTLLSGSAFLSLKHSKKCASFLRLCLAYNSSLTLNACKKMVGDNFYLKQEEALEAVLPVSKAEYLRWCVQSKHSEAVKRIVKSDSALILQDVLQCSAEEYAFLLECAKDASPVLHQKLSASYAENFLEKTAAELVNSLSVGQTEAKAYLTGEGNVTALYPFAEIWQKECGYNYQRIQTIKNLQQSDSAFFHRAVTLTALQSHGYALTNIVLLQEKDELKNVSVLTDILQSEQLTFSCQLKAYDAICASIYLEKKKESFLEQLVETLAKKRELYKEELRLEAKNSTAIGRYICIRVLDKFWQEEKETLLACSLDSSKLVKELLVSIYASHKSWEPEMLALLSSKKSQDRELAVLVLKKWDVDRYRQQLSEALEKEKSKKLQELLNSCLGMDEETAKAIAGGEKTPQELAAEILKGGKKRKISWVFETPSVTVPAADGTAAPEEYLQAILVSYADMPIPGFSHNANILAKELSEEKLEAFMAELFDKWLEGNAEAKKKWVLYAASIHGGRQIIPILKHQIQEWPQHSRGAMAAEAVKALALNGNAEALLLVDNISRKFKFRQVKTAASEALSYAAEQMGITKAELEDKIVPTLGFAENMSRTFDYGTRSFTVYLTPALELEIFDENEKQLKKLPAPGKRDEEEKAAAAYAEFKDLKKQLKTVVTNQKLRLEQALTAERLWKTDQWEALFVKNPVMHQFAIGLIWGIYENGNLTATFRYMEDGSFNTVEEDEYELPSAGTIGLVHPVELSKEMISDWKEQLSDYEITQPIPQLDREVFRVTETEEKGSELTRFGGKLLNGLSLSGKLQGMGWYRGSVQDAGIYDTFYREDGEIAVELEFSGCYVGDENEEVTVYGSSFYKAGTVKRGSYIYDTIKPENRYPLKEINPRYFSEVVLQLTKATASSQEQLPYPECKSNRL